MDMAQRGRPKGSTNKPKTDLSVDVIAVKLDNIEAMLMKNNKDIEDLKQQVAMGRGGVKVIFVLGAIVAAIATGMGLYKNVGG